jgi:hypothetical protein
MNEEEMNAYMARLRDDDRFDDILRELDGQGRKSEPS